MQTQGEKDSATIQRQLTDEATQLFNIGEPGLKLALGDLIKDLGRPGEEPASVKKAFETIRGEQETAFDRSAAAAPGTIEQIAKQTGYRGAEGAVGEATKSTLIGLEDRRRQAARALQEQESDAALATRDYEINQILGLGTGGIQQSFGFGANAIRAAGMNRSNPGGGALSGALSGASLGTAISPGWGTLIGAGVGAVGGYFAGQ